MDPKVQILWLSDIHYKNQYGSIKSKDLDAFLDDFLQYVDKLEPKNFDYLLLSGDIAQEGSKEDYEQFKKDVLTPLQGKLSGAKLLIIPGNHDVSRPAAEFKVEFIANIAKKTSRLNFFGTSIPKFEKLFEHYTNAFHGNSKLPLLSSATYKKNLLYGHVHDIEKKIIFIMLNSSWYSIGEDFLKLYLTDFLKDYQNKLKRMKSSALKNNLRKVTVEKITREIESISDEYGKQLIGLEKLKDINEILELIEDYSDHIIITIMHHPLNWLGWDERVTSSDKFHKIRELTDLLLTGHEHVPMLHSSDEIRNIRHIPAGCFMNAAKKDKPYIVKKDGSYSGNWFSTLTINIKKRTVKQFKHSYCADSFGTRWEQNPDYHTVQLNKKYSSLLSQKRKDKLLSDLNDDSLVERAILKIYNGCNKIKDNLYLRNDNLYIFNNSNEINCNIADLKVIIKSFKVTIINFIFIDLFHDDHINYHDKEDLDRLSILENIKNDFDFKFDKFRYNFFTDLTEDEAELYQNLKFVSIIKPYWELESYTSI